MKIGEAGEAFFVFETEDDVPVELVTSPILQATRPEDERRPDTPDRFDTMHLRNELDAAASERAESTYEPEFLDLNAPQTITPIKPDEFHDRERSDETIHGPESSPLQMAPTFSQEPHRN